MPKRGAGRTTRMLEEARRLNGEGRAVYVIAANKKHAETLREQFGDESNSVKFETFDSLGNFNWNNFHLAGAHPNCVVLADHFAIESQFSRMLEMLHRYDSPTPRQSLEHSPDKR